MRSRNLPESFRCAFAGLGHALRTQRNFRIHLSITIAVLVLGLWLNLPAGHWAILALTIGFVLASETLNTAAEALVDLVSPDYHPLARITKDVMAGAVLLTAIVAVVVGLLILGPPLWTRLVGR
ncbi:MAG TPA: diacylglycerol kinase family protein [Thermoflexia bacterium]|jgi:diacylglycerol kinase|nr:diacylglycerol kinase family protein [Thermoflexia bacterium]